jgi:HAD superfamily hydrolase (TIGR01509 family)
MSPLPDDVELVIFDCDGVLVDTEPRALEVDQRVLADVGWQLSADDVVERFLGRSEQHLIGQIEAHIGRSIASDWVETYSRWYTEAFDSGLEPVAGIVTALDALDISSCVASSGSHEKMKQTLGATGLYERFAGRIFSADEVRHCKPAPDLFLHAAAAMGVVASRCVVVEDSQYGVQAARAAGMRSFGYAGGLTPASWLEGLGTTVFTDMLELPALVVSSSRSAAG